MLKLIRKFISNEIKLGKEEYVKQKKLIKEDWSETKKVVKKSKEDFKDEWNKPYSETNNKD